MDAKRLGIHNYPKVRCPFYWNICPNLDKFIFLYVYFISGKINEKVFIFIKINHTSERAVMK
jgi:hypothetical protein